MPHSSCGIGWTPPHRLPSPSGRTRSLRGPPQRTTVTFTALDGMLILSSGPPRCSAGRSSGLRSRGGFAATRHSRLASYGRLREESTPPAVCPASPGTVRLRLARPARDRGEQIIRDVLKSCHAAALGLEADNGLTLDAHVTYDRKASPAWQAFVSQTQGPVYDLRAGPVGCPGGLWGPLPLDVARCGHPGTIPRRGDCPEWERVLRVSQGLFLAHDPVQSVLPSLGQELCGYVVSSPSTVSRNGAPWTSCWPRGSRRRTSRRQGRRWPRACTTLCGRD